MSDLWVDAIGWIVQGATSLGGVALAWILSQRGYRQARAEGRRDAIEDQERALLLSAQDRHRSELREAYGKLIASAHDLLAGGLQCGLALRAEYETFDANYEHYLAQYATTIHDRAKRATEDAEEKMHVPRGRSKDGIVAFTTALRSFEIQRNSILTLEDDEDRVTKINGLTAFTPDPPRNVEQAKRFLEEVDAMQLRLATFQLSLMGVFAPPKKPLPSPETKALPTPRP